MQDGSASVLFKKHYNIQNENTFFFSSFESRQSTEVLPDQLFETGYLIYFVLFSTGSPCCWNNKKKRPILTRSGQFAKLKNLILYFNWLTCQNKNENPRWLHSAY